MTRSSGNSDIDARGPLLYDLAIGAEVIGVATVVEPLVPTLRGPAR